MFLICFEKGWKRSLRKIRRYITAQSIPFGEWFDSLQDIRSKAKIQVRLDRVELGNLGNYRSVGEGVFEFRIDYGLGYRLPGLNVSLKASPYLTRMPMVKKALK